MSYDYAACKRCSDCLFGLGALGKTKLLRSVSHLQGSSASLWRGNWASKLLAVIGIPPMWCHIKKIYQLLGNCHTPGLALHTTVAGKCPSSPEDEQEKQRVRERAGTGKERLYPLHKTHITQMTAFKARQGRLMSPGTPALHR
ncbi:hypothetical protein TNCV_3955561 [Trichonephila clavipes]|nr:hypothetical protein TNCV_3955561 [Trichonephila clavipes]